MKALQQAGFRSGKMITSKNTIVYSYLVFLIGRRDFGIDYKSLRAAVARWFLMCVLTSRYTGAAETQVEKDMRRFTDATTEPSSSESSTGSLTRSSRRTIGS